MKKTVGSVVSGRETYHVDSGLSVRDAARYMTERRVGAVAVLDGDRLAGILSERDIMGRVVAAGRDLDRTQVGDVMTRDLVVARAGDSHEDGLRMMKQAGCRHLPVVEQDRLLGVASQRPPADRPLGEGRGDPLAERLHPLHSPAPGGNLLAWPGSRSSSSAPSRRRTSGRRRGRCETPACTAS